MNKNDGGPAFPVPEQQEKDEFGAIPGTTKRVKNTGMTLRDWFAGQALVALQRHYFESSVPLKASTIAVMAYEAADLMLKEREK